MTTEILGLEPKRLWYYFDAICKISHGTGNEALLRDYIISFSKEFEYKVDEAGNIVVKKGASPGRPSSAKTIVLQSHLDMVCVKEDGLTHDFNKDPIKPRVDGDWVKAAGTSLGADNGIAVAAALALLEDKNIKHGPIECLFTVREEQGMKGAQKLNPDVLSGRTMINMDAEDPNGMLYIGSAGSAFTDIEFGIVKQAVPSKHAGLSIEVSGLKGGHSGLTIHEQRGNAIKILARLLAEIRELKTLILADFKGGLATNVIPSFATARIAVKNSDVDKIQELARKVSAQYKEELEIIDPGLMIKVSKDSVGDVFERNLSDRIIDFANAAPHGVIAMSYDVKGLVQTSTNFALAKEEGGVFLIKFMSRSAVNSERDSVCEKIASLARLAGFQAKVVNSYPGWKPNLKSPILILAKKIFKELFRREPETKAVHAGLECGIIRDKFSDMDMVSLSMDLEGVHSFNERVRISSVADFWKFLTAILEEFAV